MQALIQISIIVLLLMFALTIHELSHGLAAYALGDSTAKRDGRLTLNPIRHIDPIGFLALLIARVGWAKPVMVNPLNLKNPKVDMALIAAAGPISNFMMAVAATLICVPIFIHMNYDFINAFQSGALNHLIDEYGTIEVMRAAMESRIMGIAINGGMLMTILLNFIFINIMLGIFNLIPFPPLDGSKIIIGILPDKIFYSLPPIGRYSMVILLILAVTGALSMVIGPISNGIMGLFLSIVFRIFGVAL